MIKQVKIAFTSIGVLAVSMGLQGGEGNATTINGWLLGHLNLVSNFGGEKSMTCTFRSVSPNRKKLSLRRVASLAFASVFSLTCTTTASLAVVVDYMGKDYDVTSFSGTFNNNQALLESQLWFGDVSVANDFATLVNTQLGTPNFSPYLGPVLRI